MNMKMTQKARAFSVGMMLALAVLTVSVSARPASAADLFNNTNISGTLNRPTNPTVFTLNAPAQIAALVTYHWNNGRGAAPGTIGLRSQNGQTFGPFAARGTAGQGGAPNVNWVATVNVTVPAGTYTVLDSDPATWSHIPQSLSRGFTIVRGSLVATAPAPPPGPSCQPLPSVYIRGLKYEDYSGNTRLSTTRVNPGGFFQIQSSCLRYDGRVVVTLQDVNRGNGFGVTVFQLTNVTTNGNVLTAQAPNLPILRNRTYHVAVFVYGQPWKTANPGQLSIQ